MNYWSGVTRRAWREAIDEMRWTGPLKVAQSVVPTIASGAATWGVTGEIAYGAFASLGALLIVGLAWLVQRMITLPATLHGEQAARIQALTPCPQPSLKGGFTLKPDTPLAEAVMFAATGVWDGGTKDSEELLVALNKAIEDFVALASNDRVRVFHRGFKDAPHQILNGTAWFSHRIDILDVLEGEAILRRRKDGTRIETCHDLKVCRAQFDANWDYLRSTLS